MSSTLHIEYPAEWPDALQRDRAAFEEEARMAMAVKLYELGRLSSGMAAKLAGMDRVTFILRLHEFGAAVISGPPEELESDLQNA
jgi:predicted HTH domain antitoxin